MSLQVWLPLNGNLNNQGLDGSLGFTNTASATVVADGKLGSCYSFSATSGNGLLLSSGKSSSEFMDAYINHHSWSMCAWIRTTSNDNVVFGLTYGLRLWCGSTNYVNLYNETRTVGASNNISTIDGKWHHICATYNIVDNAINIYVDGIKGTTNYYPSGETYASSWTNAVAVGRDFNDSITSSHFYFQGSMNDVRIYDHCLSAKEVKEISKGLICHYKLDNNGFGNPNLLSNSHFDSRHTVSDWDTSKNGNLCANGWGGYNEGVGNPSTVYHAHLQEHEGEYVYNYHKTSNEDWLGISQYITGSVEVSKTYTFSCELKRISGKNYVDGGLYTRANSSATSNTFVNWFSFSNFGSITDNKWHRYSYTFTVDSSVYMTNGAYWYIYGHTGGDGEFLMRRPKLEEGSSATEWIPCSSDSLYASLGLDSTTEVDCSGLSNNGTKIGGLSSSTNPLSIRYESCYDFDGNTGSIQIPNLSTLAPSGEFTMNCWIYHDNTWSSKDWETIFGGPSGFELEAKNASTNSPSLFAYSWGKGTATYELNKWNMITMTRNTSETKFYINGELKITGSAGTIPSGDYFIGAWRTSSQQNYKGRISDFRLYSTVLSVEDIKELYSTSASIDKNGNMYAYEFKEE